MLNSISDVFLFCLPRDNEVKFINNSVGLTIEYFTLVEC